MARKKYLKARLIFISLAMVGLASSYRPTQQDQSNGRFLENYPPELFDSDQIKYGAFILYLIGLLYTFMSLAIVCDDYFVPALQIIIDKYDISPDVAGATLMAAGGSAPELFTNVIGTLIVDSDVGFGTIVGSAVFNVLFVIGACSLAATSELKLTWWPLARDCTFYAFDLIMLAIFFYDEKIDIWESGLLLLFYFCYASFMKYNEQ